jgi:sporulation protein YlmC with PRC-barrel domain
MLRSLYAMLDCHIVAADGDMGRVRDFLLDDKSWIVHYLVAEIASPLGVRKVLILPFVAGRPEWEARRLPVLLTSEQIRISPPLEADMPVALQHESGLRRPGAHLRSMQELLGYGVYTTDGEVGNIEDFIIEDTLWGVHHVVVELKQPGLGPILLNPESIRSVSWPGKAVWVNLSEQEFEMLPHFDADAPVNEDERGPYDHHRRPAHSEAEVQIPRH